MELVEDRAESVVDIHKLVLALDAFREGDFTVRLDFNGNGLAGRVADAFNEVVEQQERLVGELERISQVVGMAGRLNQRAALGNVGGSWADAIASVNALISNLVHPTVETSRVIGAVAKGDLSQTMALEISNRPLQGEFLRTAKTVNRMVNQLGSFASEVTRVAREVGTDGKLGGQARVKGVAGTWKDLTDNVNLMAGNLTGQVRNIAAVTTAVANGDLTKKITVDVKGEFLELKDTINTMVDQLRSFASEVTRVAREVGTDGKLGGQAMVEGVSGTWKDLTDSVNFMASNLTGQVRNIADVTTAVANGDLSKKITVDVKGEILELKNTINTMVDQLRSFASEVTRVAREVGTEGKLGGQADVRAVTGTWKDLTDSVNFMASNLTGQVRNIAEVTTAVANGDLSKKIIVDVKGEILELKNTINTMVDQLRSFAAEVTRVAREVGTEGKLGGQAEVKGVSGTWKDLTDNVNSMAGNLTSQVRGIAEVTTAVANGDLSKKIIVDVKGEILELKNTINTMVDQLSSFASEVTRVAREVGTEGKLGGQAEVKGVSGTWKDLTDNVNSMAGNLTSQVRGIAKVVTAVANGDLNRKLTLEAKGEIAALADTINGMIETLATFADQVTTVAREVGVQGRLGGQASVPGAAGTWKALTDNVNQLAANLTTQVRAIAEVATAVTKGDLTRFIAVEAQGEVANLKDNINEMIRNLKDTTLKNSEQDWLKTNLAKFSRMLQGQKDLLTVGRLILSELAPVVSAHQAMFYLLDTTSDEPQLVLLASYAYQPPRTVGTTIKLGEGLIGQCAFEREQILLTNVPADYTHIGSGLGSAPPRSIIVLPVLFEGQVKAVMELASFEQFNPMQQALLEQLTESIGIVLNTIAANMRTEDLLKQSQSLAMELQNRQQELQQTNQELKEKARLLAHQNVEVERKNFEVEQARQALEEKAKQLALTSKYKSEFLANMSHELRTPLNSLLILSDQLSKNPDGNLTPRQTEYAQTIHSSGNDLLTLINDILDLSKIESGTVVLDVGEVHFSDLHELLERTFRHVAEAKGVDFKIEHADGLPPLMQSDTKRLQQVLKNLLSNAFKFTHRGTVSIELATARSGWNDDNDSLNAADQVVAFSVSDTGIGISPDKQQSIFEAFQQADGSTSRKYGGTGLGLAISRELARLLGGEIRLTSTLGAGSTFTLYLPLSYHTPRPIRRQIPIKPLVTKRPEPIQTIELPLEPEPAVTNEFNDDRELIRHGDRAVLIVENDRAFVQLLLDAAREKGFKGVATSLGATALSLVREYPICAVTLDICLPDINGWRVLQRLKQDLETRHIPVFVVSTEEEGQHARSLGAIDMLVKPMQTKESVDELFARIEHFVDQKAKDILVIESDAQQREQFQQLVGNGKLRSTFVDTGKAALELMDDRRFDCVVYHMRPSDTSIDTLVDAISANDSLKHMPLVMTSDAYLALDATMTDRLARGTTIRHVQSPERLLDEVTQVLHLPVAELAEPQQKMLEKIHEDDAVLHGRQVLIVDDDIRNIFALTSVLERYNMRILAAETGRDAIQILQNTPDIDVVLMDIMMPEFDGLDTTRAIREIPQFKELPIIAVTAKAMKGDREKCIEAGAWDYLSKPVNPEQMLSVLRSWIRR